MDAGNAAGIPCSDVASTANKDTQAFRSRSRQSKCTQIWHIMKHTHTHLPSFTMIILDIQISTEYIYIWHYMTVCSEFVHSRGDLCRKQYWLAKVRSSSNWRFLRTSIGHLYKPWGWFMFWVYHDPRSLSSLHHHIHVWTCVCVCVCLGLRHQNIVLTCCIHLG